MPFHLSPFIKSFSCIFLLGLFLFNVQAQLIKPTPAAERLKSLQAKRTMAVQSDIKTTFRNIGPSAMSGRVVDIDVNPDRPVEFYVAYASGGLWYTNNNGISFTPVFDSAEVLTLGDVTVHWKTGTVWVGTGEANASRSSYSGTGVYKSNDKGKTWQHMGLAESHHVGKILIHPDKPETVWVAATGHLYSPNEERGVYKTTDGGKTWKRALYLNNLTGAIDMDINPQNPLELYATLWQKSRRAWHFDENGAGSGLYKSVDGGETWQKLNTKESGLPHDSLLGRCGISLCATRPGTVYIVVDNQTVIKFPERKDTAEKTKYQLIDFKGITKQEFAALNNNMLDTFLAANKMADKYNAILLKEWVAAGKIKPDELFRYILGDEGQGGPVIGAELYKTEDAGKTWKKVGDRTLSNLFGPIGYYFGRIVVSPANPDKVLALGFIPILSTDGGKTFKSISKLNVHVDQHAAWINPVDDNHMMIGNDGGVNLTYDNGTNWFHANTPPVGQVYALYLDNSRPYNVFAGMQDNGVWYGPSDQKGASDDYADPKGFRKLSVGDGMMVLVDPRDNKTIYHGTQWGFYSRTHLDTGGYLSLKPTYELDEDPLRFNWLTPIMLSRHLPDAFYIGSNKFHRSLDKGANMQTLSPDLTNGKKQGSVPFGTITALDESPLRFGLLYAGTDDGNVQVSRDGGYNWKRIDAKLPKGLWVSRVVASAHKEGRVFVTLNGYRDDHFDPYVFISEDYGESWKPIHAGLPLECVNVMREDPVKDSILYLGTDGGCYVSKDRGTTWQIWQKGLPLSVPVYDIAIHKRQNDIVIGTHGRSIYNASLRELNGVEGQNVTKAGGRSANE